MERNENNCGKNKKMTEYEKRKEKALDEFFDQIMSDADADQKRIVELLREDKSPQEIMDTMLNERGYNKGDVKHG